MNGGELPTGHGWPPPDDLAALHAFVLRFARSALVEDRMIDELAEHLERRVAALEEVLAARWPARLFAAARLGRALRRSVEHFDGDTWADRRANAAGADWLARGPRGSAR